MAEFVEKTMTQWATKLDSVTSVAGYTTLSGPATNALGPKDDKYFGLNSSIDPMVNLKISGFDFSSIPSDATIKKVTLTVYKNGKTSIIRIYRDNTYTYPGGYIGAVGDSTQMGHLAWDITSAIKISDLVTEPLAMNLTIDTNNPKNLGKIDAIKITVDYTEYVTAPTIKRYDGVQWKPVVMVKRYDGEQWVDANIRKL